MTDVFRLPPNSYIHVLNTNSNVTTMVIGPCVFTRERHQNVVLPVTTMTTIPPQHYVIIKDPALYDEDGASVQDQHGQIKTRRGDIEIRFRKDFPAPFALCPGESIEGGTVQRMEVLATDTALVLKAERDIAGHRVGEEWLFHGPGEYVPQVGVVRVKKIKAQVIKSNTALLVKARRGFVDHTGTKRKTGEKWLVRNAGAYLPDVHEQLLKVVTSHVITQTTALSLRATRTYTDVYGVLRKAGDEWLVTLAMASSHLPDVDENVVGAVSLQILRPNQFCVVQDAYVDDVQRLGVNTMRRGPTSFFLQPGESLRDGVEDVFVLTEQTALLLQCKEAFRDETPHSLLHLEGEGAVARGSGDLWMIYGPCQYIPPVQVLVVETRRAMPLHSREGVYVRNNQTGLVRMVSDQTYMLAPQETLWEKELPAEVEMCINTQDLASGDGYIVHKRSLAGLDRPRDKTRLVTFRMASNTVAQIYDYKTKRARVEFGPTLIKLAPEEQFTALHLSGGKPKTPNAITTIALNLGPDFMSDVIVVETSDHARLRLGLSYQWHFDVDQAQSARMFSVQDFVGDACKFIASRVRNAVASCTFDYVHKHSARIISESVLGPNHEPYVFKNNGLTVTTVDIQAVEPVDPQTREFLQKCVTQAIEITTRAVEAHSKHVAYEEEEAAKGEIEQQALRNSAVAEEWRTKLLQHEAENQQIESGGMASAAAKAAAKAAEIEAEAKIVTARAGAQVTEIMSSGALRQLEAERKVQVDHRRAMDDLEIEKSTALAQIESAKFTKTVSAIGQDTIAAMARAGPEMQAELLQGLGLSGFLVTDGSNPVNLFQTANGMVSQ